MLTLTERDLYLTRISRHTSRDSNSTLFLRPHSNCTQHANSFSTWSIRECNNKLPGNTVNVKDIDQFKLAVCDLLSEQGEWF